MPRLIWIWWFSHSGHRDSQFRKLITWALNKNSKVWYFIYRCPCAQRSSKLFTHSVGMLLQKRAMSFPAFQSPATRLCVQHCSLVVSPNKGTIKRKFKTPSYPYRCHRFLHGICQRVGSLLSHMYALVYNVFVLTCWAQWCNLGTYPLHNFPLCYSSL